MENKIELKHKEITDKILRILAEHEAQLLNYLRATPYEVGFLLNFAPNPDFRRKVYDNDRKTITWKKQENPRNPRSSASLKEKRETDD
jgi:hypothetical protein